jgi:hypothetical protein
VLAPALALGSITLAAPGTASSVTAGSPSQVSAAVAASVGISHLTSAQITELRHMNLQNFETAYDIPASCLSATACVFGDKSSSKTVVVFGDSHARMWLAPLLPLAKADDLRVVIIGKIGTGSCPIVSLQLTGAFATCQSQITSQIATIDKMHPAVVLVADRTTWPWLASVSATRWQSGFASTLGQLAASGAQVVVMGDIQVFSTNVIDCLAVYAANVQHCSIANPNPLAPGHFAAEQAAASAAGDPYIDPTSWLCTATRCSPVIGSFIAYFDPDHVSVSYGKYLATVFANALGAAVTL